MTAPVAPAQGSGRPVRRSGPLTRRLTLVSLVIAALVGGAGFAAARSIEARDQRVATVDRLVAASADARQIEASFTEQETGLTEYLETHNPALLARYDAGRSNEARAEARMHAELQGKPQLLADLADVETAAAAWRQAESAHLSASRPVPDGAVVTTALVASPAVTPDTVASRLSFLARQTDAALAAARGAADTARAGLAHLEVGTLGLLVVLVIGLNMLIRRWTVTPLVVVGRAIRDIGTGGADTPVRVGGPRELVALGAEVEEMRVRERQRAAELARATCFGRITSRVARSLTAAGCDEGAALEAVAHHLVGPLADLCVVWGVSIDGTLATLAVDASGSELARRADAVVRRADNGLARAVTAALASGRTVRFGTGGVGSDGRPETGRDRPDPHPALRELGVDQGILVALRSAEEVLGGVSLFRRGPVGFDDGEAALLEDVAERTATVLVSGRLQWAVAAGETRLRLALEHSPLPAAMVGMRHRAGRLLWVNEAFAARLRYPRGRLAAMGLRDIVHPDDRAAGAALLDRAAVDAVGRQRAELRYVRGDGTTLWMTLALSRISGNDALYLAQVEAAGAHPSAGAEPVEASLYDDLTGLANRHLLRDHLALALTQMGRQGGQVAVLSVDLDRFAEVNTAGGRAAGDLALRDVAARLRECVRAPDTVGRVAGDEFAVVCAGIAHVDAATAVADRILAALRRPLSVGGRELALTASIGVAGTRSSGEDPDELLGQAAAALREAQQAGGNRWDLYRDRRHPGVHRPKAVYDQLRCAIEEGWLRLHYQPVVDLRDGRVVAAEALLRVQHPERGLVLPGEFIDVAEDSDLASRLGEWVLHEACAQAGRWARHRPFRTAVNVSARQIGHPQLADTVLAIARNAGVDPSSLALEMTERVLIDGGDPVVRELRRLTAAGVSLAVDDFGTGYSSLSYLRRFPVDTLKIDQSFVGGLGARRSDTAIVEALVTLSSTLGLVAIAEGVETTDQHRRLLDLGCPLAQGYHFSRPAPPEAVTALLDAALPLADPGHRPSVPATSLSGRTGAQRHHQGDRTG